jgi:hypothetical protein
MKTNNVIKKPEQPIVWNVVVLFCPSGLKHYMAGRVLAKVVAQEKCSASDVDIFGRFHCFNRPVLADRNSVCPNQPPCTELSSQSLDRIPFNCMEKSISGWLFNNGYSSHSFLFERGRDAVPRSGLIIDRLSFMYENVHCRVIFVTLRDNKL